MSVGVKSRYETMSPEVRSEGQLSPVVLRCPHCLCCQEERGRADTVASQSDRRRLSSNADELMRQLKAAERYTLNLVSGPLPVHLLRPGHRSANVSVGE